MVALRSYGVVFSMGDHILGDHFIDVIMGMWI